MVSPERHARRLDRRAQVMPVHFSLGRLQAARIRRHTLPSIQHHDVINKTRVAVAGVEYNHPCTWFDRAAYGSAILIIHEPGPEHIKPLRIRTVRANHQCSGRLITGRSGLLSRNDRCGYCYSLDGSQRSRCPVIPCACCNSLRKRRRCHEHASESDNCFLNHRCLPVHIDSQGS
jgi:hypothetical protein